MGMAYPPDSAALPGNITVNYAAGRHHVYQGRHPASGIGWFHHRRAHGYLEAGTPQRRRLEFHRRPPVILATLISDLRCHWRHGYFKGQGDIIGQVVSRQNSTVTAGQNFSGTLLSGGSASVSGGGTVSGTIIGVGGANVSGGSGVSASVLGQNVSVNGGAATSTLGSSAGATAGAQSAAGTTSSQNQQAVAANSDQDSDDDKKKKKGGLVRKVGRVTVILSTAVSPQ